MSPHRSRPRSLSSAFDALRDELAPATLLAQIQRIWPEVVGSEIASQATPARERSGVLTVSCAASVWAQELELMGETIISGLNARLGEAGRLERLRCVPLDLGSEAPGNPGSWRA